MDLKRTIVIGNSGSGKSWLAERVAANLSVPWVDLDLIHWEPGGYDIALNNEQAIALTKRAAALASWVIEVRLVREAESDATALVWLCIEETGCVANIRNRGIRRGGREDSFSALLQWARSYRTRKGSSSYSTHKEIFGNFSGAKRCLRGGFAESLAPFARPYPTFADGLFPPLANDRILASFGHQACSRRMTATAEIVTVHVGQSTSVVRYERPLAHQFANDQDTPRHGKAIVARKPCSPEITKCGKEEAEWYGRG